jgi:hypothetical protein
MPVTKDSSLEDVCFVVRTALQRFGQGEGIETAGNSDGQTGNSDGQNGREYT